MQFFVSSLNIKASKKTRFTKITHSSIVFDQFRHIVGIACVYLTSHA